MTPPMRVDGRPALGPAHVHLGWATALLVLVVGITALFGMRGVIRARSDP